MFGYPGRKASRGAKKRWADKHSDLFLNLEILAFVLVVLVCAYVWNQVLDWW